MTDVTRDDAIDAVQPIRDAARRALRALSRPAPDWAAATRAMGDVMDMAARLHVELYVAGAETDEREDA